MPCHERAARACRSNVSIQPAFVMASLNRHMLRVRLITRYYASRNVASPFGFPLARSSGEWCRRWTECVSLAATPPLPPTLPSAPVITRFHQRNWRATRREQEIAPSLSLAVQEHRSCADVSSTFVTRRLPIENKKFQRVLDISPTW